MQWDSGISKCFMDKASREKGVIGLKIRHVATETTVHFAGEVAREEMEVKRIRGEGAGALGRSVKFPRILQ